MKHVDGDMEDLFRQAAAKYPLRTDSADWDRLAAALDEDPGPPSDMDTDDKRRRRGFLWWWLLLPLAIGLGVYGWRTGRVGVSTAGTQGAATQKGARSGEVEGAEAKTKVQAGGSSEGGTPERGTPVAGPNTGTPETGNQRAVTQAATQKAGTSVGAMQPKTQSGRMPIAGERMMARGGAKSLGGATRSLGEGTQSAGPLTNAGGARQSLASTKKAQGSGRVNVMNDDSFDAAETSPNTIGKQGATPSWRANRSLVPASPDWRRAQTAGSFNLVVDVKAPAARKDTSAKQPKKATAKSNAGHGYIGITGAPDLSTVKMQATKGVGTTWGVLLGYAFNSHWAVESGIYLDRKKYYTTGEYFKGATLYTGETLQSVDGTCNMWEIPLNVRYNFNPGSKTTWFATAGVSSYFMTKQKYSYALEKAGYSWNREWDTTGHYNYLFSIINISGGFEQRIGKIGNLRIEPYLRIPLSGIGTGKLPIMSAGLNIGITRQLW